MTVCQVASHHPQPIANPNMTIKLASLSQKMRKKERVRQTMTAISTKRQNGINLYSLPIITEIIPLVALNVVNTKPTHLTPTHSEM